METSSLDPIFFQSILFCMLVLGLTWNFFLISKGEILGVVSSVRGSLGDLPIVEDEMRKAAGEAGEEEGADKGVHQQQQQQKVTADGTYATQSAFSATT